MTQIFKPLFLAALAIALPLWAQRSELNGSISHTPQPYGAMLVLIADGTINLLEDFAGPDWDNFQRTVLGRRDAEIEEDRREAESFFKTRFGIDVNDPANDERVALRSFAVDPRINFRAAMITGSWVEKAGTPVLDGGWILEIIDPKGMELGGEHEGVYVSTGSFARLGTLYIESVLPNIVVFKDGEAGSPAYRKDRLPGKRIINYQSRHFSQPPNENGEMAAYEVESPGYGIGMAMDSKMESESEPYMVTKMRRMVITFDPPEQ